MTIKLTKQDLIDVGEDVAIGWGAYLTSLERINKDTIRFNAIEFDESFYFDMNLIEIKEELDKINDRKKKINLQLEEINKNN